MGTLTPPRPRSSPGPVDAKCVVNSDLGFDLQCAICFGWIDRAATLACGHTYCSECATNCLSREPRCPTCRQSIRQQPVRCHMLDSIVERVRAVSQRTQSCGTGVWG